MSGFCGFFGIHEPLAPASSDLLTAMTDKLRHRGPDACAAFVDDTAALGFCQLGDPSHTQPLYNKDKTLVLAADGMVYNYHELRTALTAKGHTFATDINMEALLHLYEEYDTELVSHIRGMFAFVLYDIPRQRLICARDSFGIKPFYYTRINDGFFFASEIKAFTAHPDFAPVLNEAALAQYLCFQYSVLEETFFRGVYKLPPGHTLTLAKGEEPTIECYFTPFFTPMDMPLDKAVDIIDDAVTDAIARHTAGAQEVGAFLSSGVDSGYVAACFDGQKTFTVGFEYDNYNEIEYAEALSQSLGKTHTSKLIDTDEFFEQLPRVQYYMDEPLADPAAVAFYFACREAGRHVKVVLSGEGADEFFGGYNIYREPQSLRVLSWLPFRFRRWLGRCAAKLPFNVKGKGFFVRLGKTVEERFIGNANIFSADERAALLKSNADFPTPLDITRPYFTQVKHEDDITKMQFIDIKLWLVGDILLNADKMSMAHSLELRTPFLDREVFRAATRMPVRHRVNKKGVTKYAFRQAAKRHLPPNVCDRKKLGFPVPIRVWLREEKYYQLIKGYFSGETALTYFNYGVLMDLLNTHKSGKRDYSRKIWTVFMFLVWHEQYMKPVLCDA